jgi:hypothetical protein
LKLVADMQFQEAYDTVLFRFYLAAAWETYAGLARGVMPITGNKELATPTQRAIHWRRESFQRLANTVPTKVHPSTGTAGKKTRQTREPKPELLGNAETVNRKLAAEALGMSERTFDRHVADRKLTPLGAGARKRFNVKELRRFLSQHSDSQE